MKAKLILSLCLVAALLAGCYTASSNDIETQQQNRAVTSIVQNQPVPDLGGYSFERQVVIETYLARNRTISTWSYMFTMDGKLVEICPSIGYPIPYSTQLTAPEKLANVYSDTQTLPSPLNSVIPQSEPNGLYPPDNAAATLVQCVNPDGSVSPTYNEWYVLAFPYRVKSDYQLERIGDSSFSVSVNK